MEKKLTLQCSKCRVSPLPAHLALSYLNRTFHCEVLRCPNCGQVYLPEQFITGKVREVETRIEDDYRSFNS